MIGMEIAGGIWSSYLKDGAAVNIYVETTNTLPDEVVGGVLPGILPEQEYENFWNQLNQDKISTDDQLVLDNLRSKKDDNKEFKALADGYEIKSNKKLNLTRANAKALKMPKIKDIAFDGYVLMNDLSKSSADWNYNFLSNEVPNNKIDFVSVALHEIGHNLGFVSGVDSPGWLTALSEARSKEDDKARQSKLNPFAPGQFKKYEELGKENGAYALDLFRYSTDSINRGGYNDLSLNKEDKFFSLDGGSTALASFSTGVESGGEVYQASHWNLQDNPLGIMDPLIHAGQKRTILDLDKQAMDAIGWDLGSGEIDLLSLPNQAKERLAQRLGVEVAWLEANPVEAVQLLSKDRSKDINKMIEQSQVYEWGWSSGGRWWQEGLWQHFKWQEIAPTANAAAESVSVPEPSSAIGLLGLGGISLGFLRSRRKQ